MKKTLIFGLCSFATCAAYSFSQGTFPVSSIGNVTTFGSGTLGGGNLGPASFGFASDGTVIARGPVTFNGAGVARVTGEAASTIAKPSVAKAIARFAYRALPGVGAAVALYQLYDELGYSTNAAGVPTKTVTSQNTTWSVSGSNGTPFATREGACEHFRIAINGTFIAITFNDPNFGSDWRCVLSSPGNNYWYQKIIPTVSGPIVTSAEPVTQQEFENAIAAKSGWPASTALPAALKESLVGGEVVPAPQPAVTGPATSPGERTTTTNPDGSSTVTNTTNNYTYQGNTVTVTTTTITQNFSPTGAPVGSPTTTISQPVLNPIPGQVVPVPSPTVAPPPPAPTPPASAPITCGLPGTPPCKLDETGTKTGAETTFDGSKTAIDAAKTSAETNIGSAASIGAPSWSFSFQLPTGCAPYVTGIKGVVLNVCQYQPTIHGLLSLIWAAATAFGLIGMVGRTIREA